MSASRIIGLLLVFGALALAVVGVRSEQARVAHRIQDMRYELVRLRRESWSVQLAIARLRTPKAISVEVDRLALDMIPPDEPETEAAASLVWASTR